MNWEFEKICQIFEHRRKTNLTTWCRHIPRTFCMTLNNHFCVKAFILQYVIGLSRTCHSRLWNVLSSVMFLHVSQNHIWGPYDVIIFKQQILKTGEQYSKAFRISLDGPLMPALAPVYFNKALLNFRLFHELGIQGKSPPPCPALSAALQRTVSISFQFFSRAVGSSFWLGGGAEIEVWSPSRALQVRDFIGEIV